MTRILLAVALTLCVAAPARAEEAPSRYEGKKWEYRIENFLAEKVDGIPGMVANVVMSGQDARKLERLGQEGWELVSVSAGRAYFKRAIPEQQAKPWWQLW